MSLNTADLDTFHSDFGTTALINNVEDRGVFSNEEIEFEGGYGVFPVFRCASDYAEGAAVVINDTEYIVRAVKPLEFGEFLLVLQLDDT